MQNISDDWFGKTNAQADLIKSQINILGVTPVGETVINTCDREMVRVPNKIAVIYEFPYRKNGERFWCKQVYMADGDNGLNDRFYARLTSKVLELRKELED